MYSLTTYFYWLLILFIRINLRLLYFSLRPIRFLVNAILSRILSRHGIKLVFGQYSRLSKKELEDGGPEESRVVEFLVRDKNLLLRVISEGTMALGEGYMNNQWECSDIELMTKRLWATLQMRANPIHKLRDRVYLNAAETPWDDNSAAWITSSARTVLTQIMGDGTTFSSGYWDFDVGKNDASPGEFNSPLERALARNFEILSSKLDLRPGMRVLDVGCGTGEFSMYLAKNFDVRVTGVNISEEEVNAALKKSAGSSMVNFVHGDYKSLLSEFEGQFDRVTSLHVLEHIGGPRMYREFFNVLSRYLRADGKLLLQGIVMTQPLPLRVDLLMRKYFVQHVVVPTVSEVLDTVRRDFDLDNVESVGEHYAKTLSVYRDNLKKVKGQKSGEVEKYEKLMNLSFQLSILGIQLRRIDIWQVVASKIKPTPVFKRK